MASADAAAKAKNEELRATIDKLKAVAEPPNEKFFESSHFAAAVDNDHHPATLHRGVARSKLPQVFLIFAQFYGILVPSHKRKVPGPWVDGRRTSVERELYYLPGKSHVKDMAAVMNQMNKLQMGEWLLQHVESDGENLV